MPGLLDPTPPNGAAPSPGGIPAPPPGYQLVPPRQPSAALPSPGDPTEYAGATSDLQVTPQFLSPETMHALALEMTAGRGSSSVLNMDPARIYQKSYAQTTGTNAGNLRERQRAGMRLLPGLDQLRQMVDDASDEDWKGAFGPDNTLAQRPEVNAGIKAFIEPKAWKAPDMSPTRARAIYQPNETNNRQWDLQNGANHLVESLVDQYIATAGKGAGQNMSDARQDVFTQAMGALRESSSRNAAKRILATAETAARNMYNLPSVYDEAKTAIRQGRDPGAVRERLAHHGFNPGALDQ